MNGDAGGFGGAVGLDHPVILDRPADVEKDPFACRTLDRPEIGYRAGGAAHHDPIGRAPSISAFVVLLDPLVTLPPEARKTPALFVPWR